MKSSWKIFYDDGSTFSSDDGNAWEAPAVGVLVLMQVDSEGKRVLYCKDDYYCWEWRYPNEWVPCNEDGKNDYLHHHRGPKAVLFGRWTSNANMASIQAKVEQTIGDKFKAVWLEANREWRELANG